MIFLSIIICFKFFKLLTGLFLNTNSDKFTEKSLPLQRKPLGTNYSFYLIILNDILFFF